MILFEEKIKDLRRERKNKLIFVQVFLTLNDLKSVRKRIDNFKDSYIIDAKSILNELGYVNYVDIQPTHDAIVNLEIERKISQAIVQKKYKKIVYFHYKIDEELVNNIRTFFINNSCQIKVTLVDLSSELKDIWECFDSVKK